MEDQIKVSFAKGCKPNDEGLIRDFQRLSHFDIVSEDKIGESVYHLTKEDITTARSLHVSSFPSSKSMKLEFFDAEGNPLRAVTLFWTTFKQIMKEYKESIRVMYNTPTSGFDRVNRFRLTIHDEAGRMIERILHDKGVYVRSPVSAVALEVKRLFNFMLAVANKGNSYS